MEVWCIVQIWSNCYAFNLPNSGICEMCKTVEAALKAQWLARKLSYRSSRRPQAEAEEPEAESSGRALTLGSPAAHPRHAKRRRLMSSDGPSDDGPPPRVKLVLPLKVERDGRRRSRLGMPEGEPEPPERDAEPSRRVGRRASLGGDGEPGCAADAEPPARKLKVRRLTSGPDELDEPQPAAAAAGDPGAPRRRSVGGGGSAAAATGKEVVKREPGTAPKGLDVGVVAGALKVVYGLAKSEAGALFSEPVTDEIAPGYSKYIKSPMDLKTVGERLQKGKYKTVGKGT